MFADGLDYAAERIGNHRTVELIFSSVGQNCQLISYMGRLLVDFCRAKVAATIIGKTTVASPYTCFMSASRNHTGTKSVPPSRFAHLP